MAISLADIRREAEIKPPRILIHGVQGIGKTTFAASAPNPVFICTEEGLGVIKVPHFPVATTFADVTGALQTLLTEDHEFETVVVDSVDWLEPLVWQDVCQEKRWESIEDPGYGKGYVEALAKWRTYFDLLNTLRKERGMTIVQTAHTQIKRFNDPNSEPYDRYVIKLHDRAAALLLEANDIVLFANYQMMTVKADVGFNKKVTRATGEGDRVIYTGERPAFIAKNRYNLPHKLPLSWDAFIGAFPNGDK